MNALPSSRWPLRRLKLMAEVIPSGVDKKTSDGETPVRLCNYMDVYNNERITGDLDFMQATASNSEIARLGLQQHDVVITKDSESPQDIAVPALVEHSAAGVVCG